MLRRVVLLVASVLALGLFTFSTIYAQPISQEPPPSADIKVTKTDVPDPVVEGNNVTYTVTVMNSGPSAATGVVLTDTLLGNFTFVSATPSQGTCTQSANTVTCNIGNLANGASATVTIVVKANTTGTLTDVAFATATQPDPNTANNVATANTHVTPANAADLKVSKADSPDPVVVGNNVTYTITIKNNGPLAATGVVLTDTLPPGVTFVSASASQGSCSHSSGIVTCNLGNLANGASATATIVVTTNQAGLLINKAVVAGNEPDASMANNTAIEKTRARAVAPIPQAKIEFVGTVQSLPGSGLIGTWKVQGITVNVTENTEIKGTPEVGSTVKVEGVLSADGVVQAREIKFKKDEGERPQRDDDVRPGRGHGDKNHRHSGPPGLNRHDDDNSASSIGGHHDNHNRDKHFGHSKGKGHEKHDDDD